MLKTIVFDMDDTICFPNHEAKSTYEKYGMARANREVIDGMNSLKINGYHITIYSARRMLTHKGDINKIIADVQDITIKWLEENNVPYDEIVFGKPYSSTYYVDDKAMRPDEFLEWIK